jgi:hypothetical protein
MGLMYITSTEYNTLTGRSKSECTNLRLIISCKLLDSRIGNYPTNNGYKINWIDWVVIYKGQYQTLHQSKIDAVKLWVATMISYLTDNNNKPPSAASNLKLGRFSVGKSNVNNSVLPGEISFADSILVSSGIINHKV